MKKTLRNLVIVLLVSMMISTTCFAAESPQIYVDGVTIDELVAYKGKKSMIPFSDRIEIVRNIKQVDAAVPQYDMDKLTMCKKLGATILFVGDDWYGTEKWQQYEKEFAEAGIKIIYFPYTQGVSSTKITEALKNTRGWTNDYSVKKPENK